MSKNTETFAVNNNMSIRDQKKVEYGGKHSKLINSNTTIIYYLLIFVVESHYF